MSGGGGTNTVSTSSQPPAAYQTALASLIPQVQQTASTPYSAYTGQQVAPLSGQQIQGQNEIGAAQGAAAPFIQGAAQEIYNSAQPLAPGMLPVNASTIGQYESPYNSAVVGATEAQFANQNAQEANTLTGNAIGSGAYGGDRASVAQGVAAGQEATAQAPVIAGLENQNYAQALQEANTQQATTLGANEASAWLGSQAGYGLANLGNEALNTSLTGANALESSGALTQQEQQANLNVPYEQFIAQQAYPFQTQAYESGELTNLASSAGGTGTTSYPGPSLGSQLLGGGLAAAGIGNLTGAFGNSGYLTGANGLFSGLGGAAGGLGSLADTTALTSAGMAGSADAGLDFAMLGAGADGGEVSGMAGGGNVVHLPQHLPWTGLAGRRANDNWSPRPGRMRAFGGAMGFEPHADGDAVGSDDIDADEAAAFRAIHGVPATALAAGPGSVVRPDRTTALAGPPSVNLAQPPDDMPTTSFGGNRRLWEDVPSVESAPSRAAPPGRTVPPGSSARLISPQRGLPTPPQPPTTLPDTAPEAKPSLLARDHDEPMPLGSSGKPSTNADWGKALLYTGLGIMGGKSKFALENIGQGGLEGLKLYDAERERQQQADFNNQYRQEQAQTNRDWRQGMLTVNQQKAGTEADRAATYAAVSGARSQELMAQASHLMASAAMAGTQKEPPAIQTAKWLMQQNPDLSREDAINLANGAATRLKIATMSDQTRQSTADRAAQLKQEGLSDTEANERAKLEVQQRGQDQTLLGGGTGAAPLPRVQLPAAAGTPPPASALEPGKTIHKGYVYQGGDPGQPGSWAPISSPPQTP
jgi:hypothetical protein